ncbi:MAG TPA: DUF4012 domain-containing protein [Candidatus Dojkabacteria bacterium]|nr:DUF4012 domain-containing protein [Candidatus Dojkabacteria bacterium]
MALKVQEYSSIEAPKPKSTDQKNNYNSDSVLAVNNPSPKNISLEQIQTDFKKTDSLSPVIQNQNVINNSTTENKLEEKKIQSFSLNERLQQKSRNNIRTLGDEKNSENKKKNKKGLWWILFAPLLILLVIAIILITPLIFIKSDYDTIKTEANQLMSELDNKDVSNLVMRYDTIKAKTLSINNKLAFYENFEFIPFLKGYIGNLKIGRELITKGFSLGDKSINDIYDLLVEMGYSEVAVYVPSQAENTVQVGTEVQDNTNSDSLQTENTQVVESTDQSAENVTADTENTPSDQADASAEDDETSIQDISKILPLVSDLYIKIEPDVIDILDTVLLIDPEYIPDFLPGEIPDKLDTLKGLREDYDTVSMQLKELLEFAPQLIGSEKPVNYLLVFQNEKEMRASGGLLSSFSIITVDKGEMVGDIKSRDMWELQYYLWNIGVMPGHTNIYGQLFLMNYGCGATELRAQDAGMYPDLQVSIDTFKDYYDIAHEYNPTEYPAYDHIILVNTFFASDMVSIVEPITLDDGKVVTSENLAKEIFKETNVDIKTQDRKSIIGEIATKAIDKFTKLSTSELMNFGVKVIQTINAKNIALYSKDPQMSTFFDSIGITARTDKSFDGDYFQLNEAQNCALKANVYIYDNVFQEVNIGSDGVIREKTKVEWVNNKVYDPAEENILSGNSAFRYRAWVRVFAPQSTEFTFSDGFSKSYQEYYPIEYYDEFMQKSVSDNVIWFDHRRYSEEQPPVTHYLNIEYTLGSELNFDPEKGYKVLLQKHPGKDDEHYYYTVNYNNQSYNVDFVLDRDKIVTFKDLNLSVENAPSKLDPFEELLKKQIDSNDEQ